MANTSSVPPAASGGPAQPTQAPQTPAPPPPSPIFLWQGGKIQTAQDDDRTKALAELVKTLRPDGKISPSDVSFSLSSEGYKLGYIGLDNQFQIDPLELPKDAALNSSNPQIQQSAKISKFAIETAAFFMGLTNTAPTLDGATAAPAAPASAPAAASPAPAPAAVSPAPAAAAAALPAPVAPAQAPVAVQLQQSVDGLTNMLGRLSQAQTAHPAAAHSCYHPLAYHQSLMAAPLPQAAVAPPLLHPLDAEYQNHLANTLRGQLPRIQLVINQIPQGPAHELELSELKIAFIRIKQNPLASIPELQAAKLKIQETVYNHLRRQATAANAIAPLQTQNALLLSLLANQQPAFNPDARPTLDTLFAAEDALETALKTYFQGEIQPFLAALQQHGIAPSQNLNAIRGELAQPSLPLTRLIAINGELTISFKTILNEKVTRLAQDSQNLTAPFGFQPPAPQAGVPAAGQPIFENHTRTELVQMPLQILTAYYNYIGAQIATAPLPARIPPLGAFAATPDLLIQLEKKPTEILNAFRNYLDNAIERQPERVQNADIGGTALKDMSSTNFTELQAKLTYLKDALNARLRRLVTGEIRNGAPDPNSTKAQQMAQMLQNITNVPAPGVGQHPLEPLLAELPDAAVPLPPALERLEQIAGPLQVFLDEQNAAFRRNAIITAIGLGALATLGVYLYSYGLSLDGVYRLADAGRTTWRGLGAAFTGGLGSQSVQDRLARCARRRPFNLD